MHVHRCSTLSMQNMHVVHMQTGLWAVGEGAQRWEHSV